MEFCDFSLHDYIHVPVQTSSNMIQELPCYETTGYGPASDLIAAIRLSGRSNAGFVSEDVGWSVKLEDVWTIMSQISAGLGFIHGHGQAHRDLKP